MGKESRKPVPIAIASVVSYATAVFGRLSKRNTKST